MFAELLLREKEDRRFLDSAMSMDDSCEYDIDVDVPNIVPIGESVLSTMRAVNNQYYLSLFLTSTLFGSFFSRLYPCPTR